jgi:putative acetyltransferase
MIIRRELSADTKAVRALFSTVYSEAFFERLHADQDWLPAMSLVAIADNGEVTGHVGATRGQLGSSPALALVPPSVNPSQRGKGIGQALMHAVLGAAEALDEPLVGLVATPPDYYHRFGFRPADEYNITSPVGGWKPYFLVRPLTAYDSSLAGTFRFPDPFL